MAQLGKTSAGNSHTYAEMIREAISSANSGQMFLFQIYEYLQGHFSCFRNAQGLFHFVLICRTYNIIFSREYIFTWIVIYIAILIFSVRVCVF